jgi:hypothetical protein
MNDRIKQLAEQSGLLGPTSRIGNSHEATEKFAELIVDECAHIGYTKAFPTKGIDVYLAIKKHFGVKL